MPEFTVPPLPYPYDALEPHVDAQTMQIHHDKHHAAYVNNLNAALKDHADLQAKSVEELLRGIAQAKVSTVDFLPINAVTLQLTFSSGSAPPHSLRKTRLQK